ncbi:hypothetical protein [Streptomyces ficellus]|uniref:Uncharacterized protein n=1 Tax=Streptomyces ficellus TaxID=1977088 RepID=A0A6I6F889_9ACTN|nr:hypothetical protein [Streptomyces ficellus]QGV79074.1 hypothetical protein EIZ62_13025 [Streptomyces ficellus]
MGRGAAEERPEDGSSVSDEEWARFLREAGEGHGADAPKEPSADERERRAGRTARPAQPEGWRTGPAWREPDGRATRRRRWTGALGVLLAAGLVVVAVRPELVTDRFGGTGHAEATAPLAGAGAGDVPTLKEPFRGSPAAGWADGADGIEVPGAEAVAGMTRQQVAQALDNTKKLLVAANLDPATLRGEHPRAALDLLDPLQPSGRGALEKALADPGPDSDPLWLFSRFDPSEVVPAGDVVKVRGTLTYGKGERAGEMRVHADYTFVYPVVKAAPGSTEVARTVVRRQMTLALHDPVTFRATPGKLSVLRMDESAGNDDCSRAHDGFLHPRFTSDLLAGEDGGGTGKAFDPYDRTKPLAEQPDWCGTVSRT